MVQWLLEAELADPTIRGRVDVSDPQFALRVAYREGARDFLDGFLTWLTDRLVDEPDEEL